MNSAPVYRLSGTRNEKSGRRGAVAAELALLVAAVYVPLTIGGIYLGWLALSRERVHQSNHYALYAEGDQSELLAEQGEVAKEFFAEFSGRVQMEERDADEPEIPGDDELRKLFDAFLEPIHYRNVSAHGSFRLVGGRVVYRERVDVDEGYRIRPEGEIVNAFGLLDDNIPEDLTHHLQEYLRRRMAHGVYEHSWVHDDSDVIAGKEPVRPFTLRVPNDGAATEDRWHPEAAIRWTKSRMVGDQSPPASEQRVRVGCPLLFPVADDDRDFWHPGVVLPAGNPPPDSEEKTP